MTGLADVLRGLAARDGVQGALLLSGEGLPIEHAGTGFEPETVAALEPYVTFLPSSSTTVNINTAPAEVIYAVGRNLSLADAKRLVAQREHEHFRNVADAGKVLGAATFDLTQASVETQYFEVRGRLRLGRRGGRTAGQRDDEQRQRKGSDNHSFSL